METTKISTLKEQIQNQISINSRFIQTAEPDALACAWNHMYQASEVLFTYIANNKEWNEESIETISCMMLLNTQSDLLNALLSTLQGFQQGPGLILRSVIENLACVVAIKTNNKFFDQFKKKKLNLTATINPAKKIFPEIGQYYGLLSNFYVHENFDKIGRSIKSTSNLYNFSLLNNLDNDDLIFLPLMFIAFFRDSQERCLSFIWQIKLQIFIIGVK